MRPSQVHGPKFIPHLNCMFETIWDLPGPAETTPRRATDQKVGGSNPSERTKSPGQSVALIVGSAT
jgi:hypothetical protein